MNGTARLPAPDPPAASPRRRTPQSAKPRTPRRPDRGFEPPLFPSSYLIPRRGAGATRRLLQFFGQAEVCATLILITGRRAFMSFWNRPTRVRCGGVDRPACVRVRSCTRGGGAWRLGAGQACPAPDGCRSSLSTPCRDPDRAAATGRGACAGAETGSRHGPPCSVQSLTQRINYLRGTRRLHDADEALRALPLVR